MQLGVFHFGDRLDLVLDFESLLSIPLLKIIFHHEKTFNVITFERKNAKISFVNNPIYKRLPSFCSSIVCRHLRRPDSATYTRTICFVFKRTASTAFFGCLCSFHNSITNFNYMNWKKRRCTLC